MNIKKPTPRRQRVLINIHERALRRSRIRNSAEEDGGVWTCSAAPAGALHLRLDLLCSGGQTSARRRRYPRGHQRESPEPRGGCEGRGRSAGGPQELRLEAGGGGGLSGGREQDLPQTLLEQQPGRARVPAGPQRRKDMFIHAASAI